jgi:hypothetical protein
MHEWMPILNRYWCANGFRMVHGLILVDLDAFKHTHTHCLHLIDFESQRLTLGAVSLLLRQRLKGQIRVRRLPASRRGLEVGNASL